MNENTISQIVSQVLSDVRRSTEAKCITLSQARRLIAKVEEKAAQIGVGAIALHSAQVVHDGKIVIFARIIPLLLQKRIDQLVILFGKSHLPFA